MLRGQCYMASMNLAVIIERCREQALPGKEQAEISSALLGCVGVAQCCLPGSSADSSSSRRR
jgi:hypothetical protein